MRRAHCIILTGEIQTGKTTALQKWLVGKNAAGILSPVVSGERMLYNIQDTSYIPFQSPVSTPETIAVGRFHFYIRAFEQANKILQQNTNADWLIVDEIGVLELKDQGFFQALKNILTDSASNLLVVVRTSLLNEVREKFSLQRARILSIQELEFFLAQ